MDTCVNLAYFSHPNIVLEYARAAVNVGLWDSEKILFEKYIPHDAKLLELGCGAGRVAFGLAKRNYTNLTATDFAPPMIEMAREINLRERADIRFDVADATELAFSDATFDAVIFSFNGLQMIPQHSRRILALKEIFRVLTPGGICIFTGHDRSVPARQEHWKNEQAKWESNNQDPKLDDFGDWNHATDSGAMFIHSADPEELRRVIESVRFEVLFTSLRSEICSESELVREFSDDTRFWVLKKQIH